VRAKWIDQIRQLLNQRPLVRISSILRLRQILPYHFTPRPQSFVAKSGERE
jgi:hypothetical protein